MWSPASATNTNDDLLATSGDYLRVWNINSDDQGSMKALLNNNKHTEYCAPLTAFDWNETDPSMIGTCSIDTTVTIWDLEAMAPKTQLIAHDKEVYDVSFAPNDTHIFSTAGADGSVRLFDLRSLEHSTILYESKALSPLLRVAWNKQDPNYLACLSTDSNKIVVLDIRYVCWDIYMCVRVRVLDIYVYTDILLFIVVCKCGVIYLHLISLYPPHTHTLLYIDHHPLLCVN